MCEGVCVCVCVRVCVCMTVYHRHYSSQEDEDPDKVSQSSDKTANSSSPSPSTRRKLAHSRRRSSNQGREKQISDIDLTDIVMTEKAETSTPSPVRPFSPIDWEAVGNQAPEDPENSPELRKNHRRSSSMSETESDRAKRGEGIDERCSSPETREPSSGGKEEEEEEEEEEERDEQGRLMSSVEPKKKNELSIEWEHFDQQNREGRNRVSHKMGDICTPYLAAVYQYLDCLYCIHHNMYQLIPR